MPTLLVVHHTPSPAMHTLLTAVLDGAGTDQVEGVEVLTRAALAATASDVLAADGYLLGTPANLGYMSGALKHFFDTIYYPCLTDTAGRPYGVWVHGNDDTTGAVRAVETITRGLQWKPTHAPLELTGTPTRADTDAAWDLGATIAALLAEGLT